MKKEQLTDRIIRNKLKYHASASPDHLWDAIEAELPEEGTDRGVIWWFTGGFLGLALLLSIFAVFVFGKEKVTNNTLSTTANTLDVVVAQNEKEEEKDAVTAAIVFNQEEAKTAVNLNDKGIIIDTKSPSQTKGKPSNNNLVSPALIKNIKEKELQLANEFNAEAKKSINEATISKLKGSLLQEGTKVSDDVVETTIGDIEITNTISFATLEMPSQMMLPLEKQEKELDWPSLLQSPKCATFGKWLKLAFYGDIYVSPDMAFRELNSKDVESESYAANRKSTESQLLSYSAGARFSVVSNYGLSLRTGIVYSQINERFDYAEERSERTIIEENFDSEGNLISSDTIVESGTHYIKTYNHYRMVDIPLLVGYEVSFKKFSLSLNTGVYANLLFRQKGDFLSPELKPVNFTSDAIDTYPAFRKRLNFSVYGSIAMYYNLNDRWQLMLEPQVRYFLDPLTVSNYMVEQKYTTAGLITGLRYRF